MRARWTRRRAWTVLVVASLLAWVALGGAFNAMLDNDLARTAVDMDNFDPSKISPAAGPETKPAD